MGEPSAFLAEVVKRFRPEAAEGLRAVYQIELAGDGGGVWHLTIAEQRCELACGPVEQPDVAITMSVGEWDELVAGRLDALSAYLSGRLQIAGDLSLATRIPSLFGLPQA